MSRASRFLIDLPVRNEWSHVDLLRQTVQNCLALLFGHAEGCEVIAMVTGELLENAVKYGDWSGPNQLLRVSVEGDEGRVRVAVENPVRRDGEDLQELLRVIELLDAAPSREEAYRARMLELAAVEQPARSRLGLFRIAYEGECTLRATLLDPGTLSTVAELALPLE